jgi:uncharacterized heparinase superfamily protein
MKLCRSCSKVEEEILKKTGQTTTVKTTQTTQAGAPSFELSCQKQKKEKEKTQIQASIA